MTGFDGYSIPLVFEGEWVAPGRCVVVDDVGLRSAADLAPVLRPGPSPPPSLVAYRMYRGVCLPGDRMRFSELGIRYDVTVMAGDWPCAEPVKTLGHVHSMSPGGLSYPELYQVISGRGLFLLESADRAVLIEARPGEQVWIPPGCGHVTINPGPAPLVTANLIATSCRSIYDRYLERGGAAWHVMREDGELAFRTNPGHGGYLPLSRPGAGAWNGSAGPGLGGWTGCIYDLVLEGCDALAVLTAPELHPGWRGCPKGTAATGRLSPECGEAEI